MPSIDFMFLAESVRTDGGTFSVLGGGFDTIHIPATPAKIVFHLVFRVSFTPPECDVEHPIRVTLKDTDARTLLNIEGTSKPKSQSKGTGWATKELLDFDLAALVPGFGYYTIEIAVDDSITRSEQLRVLQAR